MQQVIWFSNYSRLFIQHVIQISMNTEYTVPVLGLIPFLKGTTFSFLLEFNKENAFLGRLSMQSITKKLEEILL